MALVADVFMHGYAGDTMVGRVICVRKEGGIGEQNRYKCSVQTKPHPRTGHLTDVDDIWIDHHYDDSPLDLIVKAIEAAREA